MSRPNEDTMQTTVEFVSVRACAIIMPSFLFYEILQLKLALTTSFLVCWQTHLYVHVCISSSEIQNIRTGALVPCSSPVYRISHTKALWYSTQRNHAHHFWNLTYNSTSMVAVNTRHHHHHHHHHFICSESRVVLLPRRQEAASICTGILFTKGSWVSKLSHHTGTLTSYPVVRLQQSIQFG